MDDEEDDWWGAAANWTSPRDKHGPEGRGGLGGRTAAAVSVELRICVSVEPFSSRTPWRSTSFFLFGVPAGVDDKRRRLNGTAWADEQEHSNTAKSTRDTSQCHLHTAAVSTTRCQHSFTLYFSKFYRTTHMHSANYVVAKCPSVCPSVSLSIRLSHASIESKRLYI